MELKEKVALQAKRAKDASYVMMKTTTEAKNNALKIIAEELEKNRHLLKEENKKS